MRSGPREGPRRRGTRVALTLAATVLALGGPLPIRAQEEVADSGVAVAGRTVPDSIPAGLSPSGAFLRSALIPGWGHVATGSLTRGAFYFGWEALSGWMVFKSHRRMGAARRRLTVWENRLTDELLRGGAPPETIQSRLESDAEILRLRELVDARSQQREDWVALGIFTLLLSGVDAFVSTHLRDFPQPLTVEGDPSTGAVEVTVRFPVGR